MATSGEVDVTAKFTIPECNLISDLEAIFGDPKFSDVTLCAAGGKEFQVHRVILAARSPVFKAMFTHNMLEQQNGRVEIIDVEPEVLREMLHYMYTGKTSNLNVNAMDLLVAADKYSLDRLKVICVKTLYESLSIENVAHIVVVARLYNINQLITETESFIITYLEKILETDSWKSMCTAHPRIFLEILTAIVKKLYTNQRTPEKKKLRIPNYHFLLGGPFEEVSESE